jgi:hypothetical protein
MITSFMSIGYVVTIKFPETFALAWFYEMFIMIGIPVIVIVWVFLFWTVFMSSISPLRNGSCNRLSDIVLVPSDDVSRTLKFEIGRTSLEAGAEFSLISQSRSEASVNGARKSQAITYSGKVSRPYYILTVPFLGTLNKLLGFGFYLEAKGWALGGLNLARLTIPTLGDGDNAIKVKFCEDGVGNKVGKVPDGVITGNLVVVDEKNPQNTDDYWRQRIFHCVHYDEKGASVYIMHSWRIKLFHPFRRPLPISRFTHGGRWMMNKDGTISPLKNPDLVLGVHPNIKHGCQRPTPTSETLKKCFADRQDLMQFCKVFDAHGITPNQLKHLTVETLFLHMKIPLGQALDMPALFQKPILLSEIPSRRLSPRAFSADLIFPQQHGGRNPVHEAIRDHGGNGNSSQGNVPAATTSLSDSQRYVPRVVLVRDVPEY